VGVTSGGNFAVELFSTRPDGSDHSSSRNVGCDGSFDGFYSYIADAAVEAAHRHSLSNATVTTATDLNATMARQNASFSLYADALQAQLHGLPDSLTKAAARAVLPPQFHLCSRLVGAAALPLGKTAVSLRQRSSPRALVDACPSREGPVLPCALSVNAAQELRLDEVFGLKHRSGLQLALALDARVLIVGSPQDDVLFISRPSVLRPGTTEKAASLRHASLPQVPTAGLGFAVAVAGLLVAVSAVGANGRHAFFLHLPSDTGLIVGSAARRGHCSFTLCRCPTPRRISR